MRKRDELSVQEKRNNSPKKKLCSVEEDLIPRQSWDLQNPKHLASGKSGVFSKQNR